MNTSPTTEERVWAVLSHLSALALGMGILLPIIGWSEQGRKSKYASFQCLQALGYQSLGYTIWLLSYSVVSIGILIVIIVMSYQEEKNGQAFDPVAGHIMVVLFIVTFGLLALYLLLPLIAAIACALGKDFRYPLMGKRLAQYLGYQQTDGNSAWLIEDHEDRWVAAMGHISVIIILWGMLVPLTAWILQGKRSLFLKFQSIQTLVYQAGATLLYLGTLFLYIIGLIGFLGMMGLTGKIKSGSPMEIVGFIFIGGSLLVLFVIILFVPLLHILGQWAGYRILKGDDYKYPIIGNLVEKRMAKY